MTPFDDALELILSLVEPSDRRVSGRGYLAEEIVAVMDSPRFDNSSVDGYAIHESDLGGGELRVLGESRAGQRSLPEVSPGRCARIFTGAPIPPGTAAVVMQEDVVRVGDHAQVATASVPGALIRRRGSEFHAGDVIAPAGRPNTSAAICSIQASQNLLFAPNQAIARPLVGVLTTGDEVVRINWTSTEDPLLDTSQIWDSTSPALQWVAKSNLRVIGLSQHVRDDVDACATALEQEIATRDVVVTVGGVSVGDHDPIREACAKVGIEEKLWRVAMKPGKPFFVGIPPASSRAKIVFGLPGNPLSSLLTFRLLVVPTLRKMAGAHAYRDARWRARLAQTVVKDAGRTEFVPGRFHFDGDEPTVSTTERRGSHMLSGLIDANVLAIFPANATSIEAGTMIDVIPFNGDDFCV